MDPSRLAMRSLNPGGCIDEAGLAEGAGLGGSTRPGKTGEAGSVSCRIQGAGSWGGPAEEGEGGPCLCSATIHLHSPVSPGDGGQRGGPTRSSVCFAGVDSLEVFIFLWGWEVFDRMKGVFGFKVIQECSDGGDGVPVPIPHGRRWRRRPGRGPGGRRRGLPPAGGLGGAVQSVGGWGRGGIAPSVPQHRRWGWWGCSTAWGVSGRRRGAAALQGRGGSSGRRRCQTPQRARRLPVQGVVSLRQLRGRLAAGAGRAVGDTGGLPVRGRRRGERLALSP